MRLLAWLLLFTACTSVEEHTRDNPLDFWNPNAEVPPPAEACANPAACSSLVRTTDSFQLRFAAFGPYDDQDELTVQWNRLDHPAIDAYLLQYGPDDNDLIELEVSADSTSAVLPGMTRRSPPFLVQIQVVSGAQHSRPSSAIYTYGLDYDADGSINLEESNLGTDPLKEDSDGDGLLDGQERNTGVYNGLHDAGTDPLTPDTDKDGLPDHFEATVTGTDPTKQDTDGDGIIDVQDLIATVALDSPTADLELLDLDTDGTAELLLLSAETGWFKALSLQDDGNFSKIMEFDLALPEATGLATALDNAGKPVVLAWREADGQAVLLRDEGEGFDAVARPFVPIRPDHVALNAGVSGRITLAATSAAEALLTVLEFDLEGKELGRQLLPLEQGGRSLHWLDLDLDTRRDLLVLNEQTPSLSIFYLQADGTYRGSGQALAKKPYLGFGLTTVDADRLPDLVLLDERGFSISRHEHGLFSALLEVHSSVRPTALEVLRDGEHRLVAVLSGTESTLELFAFTVMPTDTPLAAEDFSSVEADRYRELLRVNNGPELLRTGFVDDDQKPDFLTLSNRSRSVSILFGKYLRYHADQAF
ncbi:MAG: hypothetical protein A2284_03615 [Deltaproteobacteria bacterium RIFOXYA12_FULL_61_11]|nr:MAG: hypothetical protein A2284_03615 [Deltaproteobacteria bacterium RIFOXYA12_FULL_61_11]